MRTWALYLGFGALTCSMLLVQQFLTRVFSIQFNSGLAFLAISTTFLGLGAAGVALACFPQRLDARRAGIAVPWLALVYAVSLLVGFVVEVCVDRKVQTENGANESIASQVERVLADSSFLLPSMFLVGLVIALVLRAHSARVSRLYGADLLGGGVGCLCVLPLMDFVGGDQGIFVIALLAATGAALLAHAGSESEGPARRPRAVAIAFAALVLALPFANRERQLVDVQSHRTVLGGVGDWVREDVELARDWNSLSRLGFFPTRDDGQVYVRIDSSCQTTVPSKDAKKVEGYVARTNFERLPFVLDRHRRCLEIGAGGGRGMVLAKALGAERITGVEINPGIVEAAKGRFPGYGIDEMLHEPGCALHQAEGRSYVRSTDERFDSLTITFIQTGVASGSAAFALSEANLFTVEAFADFLGKLDPDGVFYVYRHGGIECMRLLATLGEAMQRLGVLAWRHHLFVARNAANEVLVLVGRSPLRGDEIDRLEKACAELSLQVVYAPGEGRRTLPPNPFPQEVRALRERGELSMATAVASWKRTAHASGFEPIEATYVNAEDPVAFRRDFLVDVEPSTDDRPYFFFTGLRHLGDFGLYFDPAGTGLLGGTVVMLFWMGCAFAAAIAVLIVLPLVLRRRPAPGVARARGGAWVVLYFAGIGIGYIAVQISFVQRFTLFLGHPVYAVSVVLMAFLLASGLGSSCSDRFFGSGRLGFGRLVLLLGLVLLAYDRLLPVLFHSDALAWPITARLALSVLLVAGLAFPMGMFFPQGIHLVERTGVENVPWAWGANSAASVIGSVVALVLAIHFGFSAVALAAVLVYALLVWPAAVRLRRAAGPVPAG